MSSFWTVEVDSQEAALDVDNNLRLRAGYEGECIERIGKRFEAIAKGVINASVKVITGGVKASGTITFSSLAAADVVTINGVVFTARVSPSGTNEFALGASDTAAATNLAAKINASALAGIVGVVVATSALGVVTITAVRPGLAGNAITTVISAHGTAAAARLTSGAEGTSTTISKGR